MTYGNSPQWRPEPEPTPPNALERLMSKGVADPARHGEMFRKMLESELFLLIPGDGLAEGMHPMNEDFRWHSYRDEDGDFIPVFTSEAVAAEMVKKLPPDLKYAIAGMGARMLLELLGTSEKSVRVYASPQVRVILDPQGIAHLLDGDLTEARPSTDHPQTLTLHPIFPHAMPQPMLDGIRDFCSKRRVPLGVYAFHAEDPGSGEVVRENLHLILWLRGTDNHFYNDFVLMAQKLSPEGLEILVGVITSEQTEQVEFLSTRPPIWPDLEPVGN
ncbi:MAG: SseB family protein [Verrucomicrobiota bacterium]